MSYGPSFRLSDANNAYFYDGRVRRCVT